MPYQTRPGAMESSNLREFAVSYATRRDGGQIRTLGDPAMSRLTGRLPVRPERAVRKISGGRSLATRYEEEEVWHHDRVRFVEVGQRGDEQLIEFDVCCEAELDDMRSHAADEIQNYCPA